MGKFRDEKRDSSIKPHMSGYQGLSILRQLREWLRPLDLSLRLAVQFFSARKGLSLADRLCAGAALGRVQGAFHSDRIIGNHRQIGASRLIRLQAALLPIP